MSKRSLLATAAVAALAIIAPSMAPAQAADEIKIGVITSTSGALKSYGDAYVDGLNWGLKYYTGGKMTINGQKLVVTVKDDAADPASATATFKDMVGNGTKVIVGTASSGVALTLAPLAQQNKVLYISGPAKNDAVTSAANKYVFRSGNTSTQDLAPLAGIKPISGRKVVLFVEDNAFGAGNIYAAKALMGPKGATFQEIKVPTSTSDFTPFAKQAADAKGSYIFIAWSNALTAGAMLTALKQQGAFVKQRPITGLAGAATYNIYGALFEGTNAILTNSYFGGVGKSKAAEDLANSFVSAKKSQDLFTCTGADAAKMIVQALTGNNDLSVDQAISNLEGYTWVGVKGLMKVNPSNHVLTQPMFLVSLKKTAAGYVPVLEKTINSVTA
ncbi:MAG: ABC transporter substrate-binding protein [Actinomycetales bacterium]|nr:ABC transporter substrate-binding protein [Actinomycetales bacterium]